jgi:uncharacterized protein (PEP-CTERM system associated)
MDRRKTERRNGDARLRRHAQRCLGTRPVQVGVALAVSMLGASPALAQRWMLDASVSSQLTWTNNTNLGTEPPQKDTILELTPRLSIRGEGARLRLSGTATLNGIAYLDHTQPNTVLPTVDLNARLEAIERLFFVEAAYRAAQTSQNLFGARPEGGTTANTLTTSQTRLSPYIDGRFGPEVRYRLRSDNTWSNQISAASESVPLSVSNAGGYFGRHTALVEHDPRPFGWRMEAERSETRYRDSSQRPLTIDLARLTLGYALGSDFTAGVRLGVERNNFLNDDGHRNIYGVEARWQPSPRTTFTAFDERRFFGSGWSLGFDHRISRLALSVNLTRRVETAPQSLFELPAANDVVVLLDSMLIARYPDPIERGKAVQDIIAQQGLPRSTTGPTTIYSERLSIVTRHAAGLVWTGPRSSLAFSAFQARTEDAVDTGPLSLGTAATNNLQHGATITLTHRLTRTTSFTASTDWSRIRGLGLNEAERSTQNSVRAQVNVQTAPHTSAFVGARHRHLSSTIATPGRESAAFAGVNHRF